MEATYSAEYWESPLTEAIQAIDNTHVRMLLDDDCSVDVISEHGETLYHSLIRAVTDEDNMHIEGRHISARYIIYMLRNSGLDVNIKNQADETALHLAVGLSKADPALCEPLLQCGADMKAKTQSGWSPLEIVMSHEGISESSKQLFEKYSPGLWDAVDQDDIMSVRKLINLWCRADIKRDEKTLFELTLDKGTENIIRLIKEIGPSMDLAHGVLAGDMKKVAELCNSGKDINTEFRNLGDRGATPLYYAIQQNSVEIVGSLIAKGAKIDATIALENELDMPVYFASLTSQTDSEVIRLVTPKKTDSTPIHSLCFRGKPPLFCCIHSDVHPEAFDYILQNGSADLLAVRDENNRTPRDFAEELGKEDYIQLIDQCVCDWFEGHCEEPLARLALMGYDSIFYALDHAQDVAGGETTVDNLHQYLDHIKGFVGAVEEGNMDAVSHFVTYTGPGNFQQCLADARQVGDGQPALHKAVLRQNAPMVGFLAETITTHLNQRLDDVRDQCYRTALHYAYGMENRQIINILLDFGSSEFTMDKDCRSPLVFKERAGLPEMSALIERHLEKDYFSSEPNPWAGKHHLTRHYVLPNNQGDGAEPHAHGSQDDEEYFLDDEDDDEDESKHGYCIIV